MLNLGAAEQSSAQVLSDLYDRRAEQQRYVLKILTINSFHYNIINLPEQILFKDKIGINVGRFNK